MVVTPMVVVRAMMLEAAIAYGAPPERISFKGTVSSLRQWAPLLAREDLTGAERDRLFERMLFYIAKDLIPLRPGRREPRAKKRRPNNYQFLTKPRHLFQELSHRGKRKSA